MHPSSAATNWLYMYSSNLNPQTQLDRGKFACRSPLSPWQSVKKSPASQHKPQISWTHSPSPAKGVAGEEDTRDVWKQDKAQKLRQKLQVRETDLCDQFIT